MNDAIESANHRATHAAALGNECINMLEQLLLMDEASRAGGLVFRHITTVGGHNLVLSMEYEGFQEPKGLIALSTSPPNATAGELLAQLEQST